jgi:activator of 2-hydroxyglutaryl-CoA dehydratase
MIILGLDIGPVISKAVLMDESLRMRGHWWRHSAGDPAGAIEFLIEQAVAGKKDFTSKIGLTGSGRESFHLQKEISSLNEILSIALGAGVENPGAKSIIAIGGHSSCWIRLEKGSPEEVESEIADFTLNERCAAGSGAFLEQQAKRLKLSIEEFSELAADAAHAAPIAGRCSVFAKTDMIYLQQKGRPVDEISYGVCLAMARNFIATILRGRECVAAASVCG